MQRSPPFPAGERGVGLARAGERALGVQRHHRVDRAVHVRDAPDVRRDDLDRRDVPRGDQPGELRRRGARELDVDRCHDPRASALATPGARARSGLAPSRFSGSATYGQPYLRPPGGDPGAPAGRSRVADVRELVSAIACRCSRRTRGGRPPVKEAGSEERRTAATSRRTAGSCSTSGTRWRSATTRWAPRCIRSSRGSTFRDFGVNVRISARRAERALPLGGRAGGLPRAGGGVHADRRGRGTAAGQWDYFHCPADTGHVFVGAGDGPCAILMIGLHGPTTNTTRSARSPPATAPRSRRRPTTPNEAYADWAGEYRPVRLPWPP